MRRSAAQIFAWPLAIGIASFAGLILGLTGEGWRDFAAWLLLGAAPAIAGAAWLRRDKTSKRNLRMKANT